MMKKIIRNYVSFSIRRHKLVVLLAILAIAGGLFISSNLNMDSSVENMLPEDNEVITAMTYMEEEFGNQDNIIVAVKGEDSSDTIIAYLDTIATRIEEENLAKNIIYKVEMGEFVQYFSSESNDLYLMNITPNINFSNIVEERDWFFQGLNNIINETLEQSDYIELKAGVTGGALIQDYESDNNLSDGFILTGILTLILIICIFILSFRRIFLPLATTLPLLLGVILTASFSALAFEGLNMLSISFAVLLLGMGIDYAIHILARYGEQRAQGEDLEGALISTLEKTGMSMLIGSITTALAFSSFIFARMQAFTQMGIISAVGIFLAMISQLLVTPALIAWADHKKEGNIRKENNFEFMRPLGSFVSRKGFVVIAVTIILMAVTFMNVISTKINSDLSSLYPSDLPSLDWLKIVEEEFDYNPDEISLMAKDLAELADMTEKLSQMETVDTIDSIVQYLPEEKEYWEAAMTQLPAVITDNYIGTTCKHLIKITATGDVWDRVFMEELQENLYSLTKNISGMPVIMSELIAMVIDDALLITSIAALAIFLVLLITFRSIRYALINMVPLLSTIYLLFGLLPVLQVELTIISIVALPLIIGIGVAGAVHVTNRVKHTGNIPDTLVFTGKAIILSSVTTLVGFGSLMFAGHPALSDLGKLVTLGLALNLILNVTLLPALLALVRRRN